MSIVKRVENKLKNLEQRHPNNDFVIKNHNSNNSDEKKAMELTNSRKNSQQVLPSNAINKQKATDLQPFEQANRVQSMNYIALGNGSK